MMFRFRETSGHVSGLREKLDEVNWTVGAVNHTFSNDISVHHLKIQDLQVRSPLHLKKVSYCSTKLNYCCC